MNVCFFNHWHNGDLFSGRGFIKHIMDKTPNVNYTFAHNCSPKILSDLGQVVGLNTVPVHSNYRFFQDPQTFFINSWVGVYIQEFAAPGEQHGNWISLQKMFSHVAHNIGYGLGESLTIPEDPLELIL